ncbi:hypothetical protein CTA1_10623 [Colletotrichum tanaceti]|uniref:Uncharacterized protein n=1 Tax=Colletotrichum tanaceti TaxID=1306861 RepID=A0A4U6XLJ3_9PEZI|nr:hypothetical protein CTA1_10623 [Colletotrichum tanaceti]
MMKYGVYVPKGLFSDSVAVFKVMKGKSMSAKLELLRDKHAPPGPSGLLRTPPDPSGAPMHPIRNPFVIDSSSVPDSEGLFSIDSERFKGIVGLNVYESNCSMAKRFAAFKRDLSLINEKTDDTNVGLASW